MKAGFRQSMAWLHTWSGLILGWLLFAVFLTGTLSYFRNEITYWMQPELHGSVPGDGAVDHALTRLQVVAPNSPSWRVSLPDERRRTLQISWQDENAQEQRRGGGGGRNRGPYEILDAGTGEVLKPRETAGGNFIYRFHFELYALPRDWARWIVGIATMVMFVAILSGIITHKKIFTDFFTFRPQKGQRSWLDAHAVTAVLALPFHLMITYSGLLLFVATLIPWNVDERRREGRPEGNRDHFAQVVPAPVEMAPLALILEDARTRWNRPVAQISIQKPMQKGMTIELAPKRTGNLSASSGGGGGAGGERLVYDGVTGKLKEPRVTRSLPDVSGAQVTANVLGTLHRARFAEPLLRWLFFLSGVGGTIMVGSGLVLWVVKRVRKPESATRSQKLVQGLNVGSIAGLVVAVAAYFWANRLIPADVKNRPDWEIGIFFVVWAFCLLYPLARSSNRAWIEQLAAAALLFITLPVLNAFTSSAHFFTAIADRNWLLLGFDAVVIATGASLAYAAWWLMRAKPEVASKRQRAQKSPIAGIVAAGHNPE